MNLAHTLKAHILIVDDQASHVKLLARMLGEAGYERVSTTQEPAEVAALYREWRHDLILLDLQMPGMDGFQVMEALASGEAKDYVPVIALTAQPMHKLRALQAGAKDFISKPFDAAEIKNRIHNFLEVRLLYRELENYSQVLEQAVIERTADLRESEERFRRLAELASDWYWEQDANGRFIKASGPVHAMLGLDNEDPVHADGPVSKVGWNENERAVVRANIAARQPFIDAPFSRVNADGSVQRFRVSGEPMFNRSCSYIGYRGIGVEILNGH